MLKDHKGILRRNDHKKEFREKRIMRRLVRLIKENVGEEWVSYGLDLMASHFFEAENLVCEECLDYKNGFCRGGYLPDCFMLSAKSKKEISHKN